MPEQKYIILSNCRIDKKHVPKGTVISLDRDDKVQEERFHILARAGRLGTFSPENLKAIKTEAEAEQRDMDEAQQEEKVMRAFHRQQRMAALRDSAKAAA